jgi:hypothetical protein
MTDPPLISVIVPVYDLADHVAECLDSLRDQTLTDFEALVIDDGSRDDSAARADRAVAGDARFRRIRRGHAGLSAARNAGLDAARGAFVAFIDGDDRVMPDFLARLHRVLEDTGGDWVACGLRYCYPDGTGVTHSAVHDAPAPDAHPALARHRLATWPDAVGHFPSAWNKLYRRALIGDLRFDEGTWFEDHAFFLRVAARTDHLWHLPEPLYLQTQGRPGQITARDDDRVFQQFEVLDRLRDILAESPRPGGDAALATLERRLTGERARALAAPDRRARFLQRAAARDGMGRAHPDPCLREEMRGCPPLSVIVAWDGVDADALAGTLAALAGASARGQEVLILCPDRAARGRAEALRPNATMRLEVQQDEEWGARGTCLVFVRAGERPDPDRLDAWAARLLETGADLGLAGADADAIPRSPHQALAWPLPFGAHVFRRAFLVARGLRFDLRDDGGWALCLGAELAAGRVVALPGSPPLARGAPPVSARALLVTHDARVAALPAPLAARLPSGWQRRLFLRALWRNWCAAQGWPRPRRRAMVLAALAGALRRGYRHAAPPPAGLDPDIPPRIARFLGAVEPPPPDPVPQDRLTPFATAGEALLRLRADLAAAPCVNLSFLAADRVCVPLHLSLRRDEGRLVHNTRDASGTWQAERPHRVALEERDAVLSVGVSGGAATVTLDGCAVLRIRLPDGPAIAFFETEGPVTILDAVPGLPAPGDIVLDARFMLRTRGGAGPLRLGHEDRALPDLPDDTTPYDPGSRFAALPGSAWVGLPADAPLEIAGAGLAPLAVTRAEMAARLDVALGHRIDARDAAFALALLEHLIHGRFADALSAGSRASAQALAARFGLAARLPRALPPPEPVSSDQQEIRVAVMRFAQAMSADPPPDPLRVLRGLAVPGTAGRGLWLALAPVFAEQAHDGATFARFAEQARAAGITDGPLPDDAWSKAALLPLVLAEGRGAAAREALWSLVPPSDDWLPTACIAHLARHAPRMVSLAPTEREGLIYGYMEFVSRRLDDYRDRAPCLELTRAAAELIGQRALMPDYLREAVEWFCLRAYGLSRPFWAALEAAGSDLSPRLAAARAAFDRVAAGGAMPPRLWPGSRRRALPTRRACVARCCPPMPRR